MKTTTLVLKILRLFTQTIPQPWQAAAVMAEEFTIRGSSASSTHRLSCYEKRLATGQNSLLFMCTRRGPGRGRWRYLKETLERVEPRRLPQTFSAGTAPTATTWITTTGKGLHYRLLTWVQSQMPYQSKCVGHICRYILRRTTRRFGSCICPLFWSFFAITLILLYYCFRCINKIFSKSYY